VILISSELEHSQNLQESTENTAKAAAVDLQLMAKRSDTVLTSGA